MVPRCALKDRYTLISNSKVIKTEGFGFYRTVAGCFSFQYFKLIVTSLYLYLIFVAGQDPPQMSPGTYWRPGFFDCLKEEYQACREGVALMDMSSFAKFQITVRITCCPAQEPTFSLP